MACIRLNKLWAEESARILWAVQSIECRMHGNVCARRRYPLDTTCRLMELAESGRLQWYARYIRHLCFIHYSTTDYSSFVDISFRSLETLNLLQPCSFCSKDDPRALDVGSFNVLQFLQPRLRHLRIGLSRICGRFFMTLLVCSSSSFLILCSKPI